MSKQDVFLALNNFREENVSLIIPKLANISIYTICKLLQTTKMKFRNKRGSARTHIVLLLTTKGSPDTIHLLIVKYI